MRERYGFSVRQQLPWEIDHSQAPKWVGTWTTLQPETPKTKKLTAISLFG
jgi:hypothetical protein